MPTAEPTASLMDYCVDVWFLYGSFTYGLESRVCSFTPQSLTLEVVLDADDSAEDVAAFLETLVDNPRGLVRSELCVYLPHENDPIRVFTEIAPTLAPTRGPNSGPGGLRTVRLRFSHVCAPTPEGDLAWRDLLTRVWPRLTSA